MGAGGDIIWPAAGGFVFRKNGGRWGCDNCGNGGKQFPNDSKAAVGELFTAVAAVVVTPSPTILVSASATAFFPAFSMHGGEGSNISHKSLRKI